MQVLETVATAIRGRMQSRVRIPEKGRGLNRWTIYKQLCVAKSEIGLNDRCLAVLSSLLSFLPEDEINEKHGLVVFPSNRQLSLRAHGMPESTLRRHLASLVEAGIIERKDSPTRKRYAHKDNEGVVEVAFGFSFAPLVSRSNAIAQAAERIVANQKVLKRLRDEVSVIRREIASGFAEIAPDALSNDLEGLFVQFREIVNAIPRRATVQELQALKANLKAICSELDNLLKKNDIAEEMSASDAQ
ncbi:MAG: plasmid replication protein RepC, partial [Stenotrophomonas geniculata]